MSFIRERIIGTDTVFNDQSFIQIDISGIIDLSTYATNTHLETNPLHLVVYTSIVDETEATGAGFVQRFTIFYDANYFGGNYIVDGIVYDTKCPIYFETFGDGVFEWSTEGTYVSFDGSNATIFASVRSIGGIDLRIRSYIELYINSNVQ
jgi:hypothetical protein